MSPPRRGGGKGHGRTPQDGWPPEDATDDDWPPPEWDAGRPIPVEGGIAAATRRGPIGSTWWSRRFLGALEAVMVGGRMQRGRSYARKGQVISLDVGPGAVEAPVQGSRDEPYRVRLVMPVVPDDGWTRIVASLASQAGYAARMLAGDLPHEVEQVFADEGESLFPAPHSRLTTSCTCPDWENPCKHIAAVCYLLAERFDADPFELLAWRGRDREEILGELRALRSASIADTPAAVAVTTSIDEESDGASPTTAAEGFFDAGPELAEVRVRVEAAAVPAAALRQLPRGLLVVGADDLADALAPAYATFCAAAAQRAAREV